MCVWSVCAIFYMGLFAGTIEKEVESSKKMNFSLIIRPCYTMMLLITHVHRHGGGFTVATHFFSCLHFFLAFNSSLSTN